MFKNTEMLFSAANYRIMLVGVALILIGFVLMIGGGTTDPESLYPVDSLYGPRRTIVAPALILVGFVINGYAIMRRADRSEAIEGGDTE